MSVQLSIAAGLLGMAAQVGGVLAAQSNDPSTSARHPGALVVAQVPQPPVMRPPTAAQSAQTLQARKKNCRREPIWGFRMSAFCKPTGICSDRVIKGYRTVCS